MSTDVCCFGFGYLLTESRLLRLLLIMSSRTKDRKKTHRDGDRFDRFDGCCFFCLVFLRVRVFRVFSLLFTYTHTHTFRISPWSPSLLLSHRHLFFRCVCHLFFCSGSNVVLLLFQWIGRGFSLGNNSLLEVGRKLAGGFLVPVGSARRLAVAPHRHVRCDPQQAERGRPVENPRRHVVLPAEL